MVCSEQIKAARALLGWSAGELAKRSGVGATTLRRYEMLGGIPHGNINVLLRSKRRWRRPASALLAIHWLTRA